jgi:MFS family permease
MGIHGTAATVVRFFSGPLFERIDYRATLGWLVAVNALAVMALSGTTRWWLLAVAWGSIGLTRGVLRVASGALVMDTVGNSDRARGAASMVYLAGGGRTGAHVRLDGSRLRDYLPGHRSHREMEGEISIKPSRKIVWYDQNAWL